MSASIYLSPWSNSSLVLLVRKLQRKFQTVRPIRFFCKPDGKSPFTRHPLNSAKRPRRSVCFLFYGIVLSFQHWKFYILVNHTQEIHGNGSIVQKVMYRKLIYLHFLPTYRPLSGRDLPQQTEYQVEVALRLSNFHLRSKGSKEAVYKHASPTFVYKHAVHVPDSKQILQKCK